MRLYSGLAKTLWADIVNTVAYLINRKPCVPLGFKISKDKYNRKETPLSQLKVFYCVFMCTLILNLGIMLMQRQRSVILLAMAQATLVINFEMTK